MTNHRQRSPDEPPIANRIRWFYPVLTGLVCLGLLAPAYGQTVNLQFNASATVANPSSVLTCTAFTFGMNYGVVSEVTVAQGAKITLPLKGFTAKYRAKVRSSWYSGNFGSPNSNHLPLLPCKATTKRSMMLSVLISLVTNDGLNYQPSDCEPS